MDSDDYMLCLNIATKAHKGQFRKYSNLPYIVHPIAVASNFNNKKLKCAAILHDVIEDTEITEDELLSLGVPKDIVKLVVVMTHCKNETYAQYINRILNNPKAVLIKIADMSDNMLTAKDGQLKRYENFMPLLKRQKLINESLH